MSPAATQCLMCSVWKIALHFFTHIHLCLLQSNDLHFMFLDFLRLPLTVEFQNPHICSSCALLLQFSSLFCNFFFNFVAQFLLFCVNLIFFSFSVHLSSEFFSDSVQKEILMHLNTWNTFQTSLFLSFTVNMSSWLYSNWSCIFLGQ